MRTPYVECPLCSATAFSEERVANCTNHALYDVRLPPTMRWLRCETCTHVFVDGYFTEEANAVLYSKTHGNQAPSWTTDHASRLLYGRIITSVMRHLKNNTLTVAGKWLDVGFGNGLLLAAAQDYGFKVLGIDQRASSVKALLRLGFDAQVSTVDALVDRSFDVVSMADVLEHMPFPKKALLSTRNLIAPGGCLFLSMPDSECFGWRSYDVTNTNPYWQELEHVHNFGRSRLYRLLEECGFKPVAYAVNERYYVGMEIVAILDA